MTDISGYTALLATDGSMEPQTLVFIGFGILFITMIMWRGSSKRKNVEKLSSIHSQRHNIRKESIARDEANAMMIKLAELSREICGQIDTRYAKLEHSIIEADRKIEELRKISELLAKQTGQNTQLVEENPISTINNSTDENAENKEIVKLAAEGADKVEIAKKTGKTPGEIELILSLERNRKSSQSERPASKSDSENNETSTQQKGSGFDARA